jgi:hypothetical protein
MKKPITGMDPNALQGYLKARICIARHADRIVAVTHLMSLLRHFDGVVEVSTDALAAVADLIDQDNGLCCGRHRHSDAISIRSGYSDPLR